jgi:hypothetical protein
MAVSNASKDGFESSTAIRILENDKAFDALVFVVDTVLISDISLLIYFPLFKRYYHINYPI